MNQSPQVGTSANLASNQTGGAAPKNPTPRAGDCLRHPLVILMLVVWMLNDHLLKEMFGNAVTGKLSDFAGVAVFPLIPVALYEVGCSYCSTIPRFQRPVLLISLGATGLLMAGINLLEPWADALIIGLGAAQWPFRCMLWLATEGDVPSLVPVHHTVDPTDLSSLIALGLPYWIVTRGEAPAPRGEWRKQTAGQKID